MKKLISIILVCIFVFSIPLNIFAKHTTDKSITLVVSENENAALESTINNPIWQVYIDSIDNWVTIAGEDSNVFIATPAKLLPILMFDSGTVLIRCINSLEESETFEIYVDATRQAFEEDETVPQRNIISVEDALTYNIIVNFIFTNGEIARDPFIAIVDAGDSFNSSVPIPYVRGYKPYYNGEELTSNYFDISINSVTSNITYNIVYQPDKVVYYVEHYLQNTYNDDYTLYETESFTGFTMSRVGDVAKDYAGFYALLYEHPEIAADGSTVVQIYYDRYYYLVDFKLNGGTGVDPIYARYGTPLNISDPTKIGYVFAGWDKPIASTVPLGGDIYSATWTASNTTYNVAFWYENTDGLGYYIVDNIQANGLTGQAVSSSQYQNTLFEGRDDTYFIYDSSQNETVTISGDGTTLLNVYFNRVNITFNFYNEPIGNSEASQSNTNLYYTITGKYGSTFAQNNATWPSEYSWSFWRHDGNTGSMGMTFMDALLPTSSMGNYTTINFYTRTASGNKIYFLKERDDGTFYTYTIEEGYDGLEANADNIVISSGTFYFSEKYQGYSLKDYQSSGTNYRYVYTQNGQTHTYTGIRVITTTSTTTLPQYGVVDGEFVELDYITEKIWYLPYIYTATTNTSGNYTYYGIKDSEYYVIASTNRWLYDSDQVYTGNYVYQETTATSSSISTYYGFLDGNIITFSARGYFYNGNTRYTSTYKYAPVANPSEGSSGRYYYFNNGTMSQTTLYYHNGQWYRTRSGYFGNYNYSNPVGQAYSRSNTSTYSETGTYYGLVNNSLVELTAAYISNGQPYFGQRYTRLNTPSTTNDNVTYFAPVNGEMKQLYFDTSWIIQETNEIYTGTRYTRTANNSSNAYTGTRYIRTNSTPPYTYRRTEDNTGTQYGIDENLAHQELSSVNTNGSFYYNGIRYTGTRYVETDATTGTIYGFVDGVRYTLTRQSYTGFGDSWTKAVVGNSIPSGYDYIIRYERTGYKLQFYNHSYYMDNHEQTVKYNNSLSSYDFIPEYPYSLPNGAYTFVGWYDNQQLLGEPFDFNTTMPASNLVLYAKYQPRIFTVNVYRDLLSLTSNTNNISTEQVSYGNLATVPNIPTYEDYTFVGWFYQNKYGEEYPFQFSSMEITQNMNIYGKWTSETLVTYTIHYTTDDGTPVANDIMNSALAGSTKTFSAKTGNELFADYRSHWYPLTNSHSILMDLNNNNTFTFVYVYREFMPYTVKYVNATTGEELLPDKVVTDNINGYVTEQFVYIPNYVVDAFKKSMTLSITGDNTITFYYMEDDGRAPYVTNYYIQTENGYELYNYRNDHAIVGSTVNADIITISGYNVNTSAPNSILTGTVLVTGLELNVYYDRIQYPYKVRYLEQSTMNVLAPEVTGMGYYSQQLTFTAPTIIGYNLIGESTQTLVIKQESGDEIRNNIITFYYRVEQAEFNYIAIGNGTTSPEREFVALTGFANGSTPIPNAGAEFLGWYLDASCTIPVTSSDGSIENNTFVPAKQNGVYISTTYYAKFSTDHILKVNNTVSGNMGSVTKEFHYVLEFTSNIPESIIYTKNGISNETQVINNSINFTLKHGEEIEFTIPHNVAYHIVETDANIGGYITTVTGLETNTLTTDQEISYLNVCNVGVPTGITTNFNTYVMSICILFSLLLIRKFYIVLRRKNYATCNA